MKTKQWILATLLTVISVVAQATDGGKNSSSAKVKVTHEKENIYHLLFRSNAGTKVTINIRNATDRLVFTETIKEINAFVRPYNFSQLPQGKYMLEVIEGDNISRKTIYHGVEEEMVITEDTAGHKFPNLVKMMPLTQNKDVYRLTIVNNGKKEALIRIYNSSKKVIYSAVEAFENVFCKLYNMKNVEDQITVEVEIDGKINQYVL